MCSRVRSFSVEPQDTAPQGIAFSSDGTKMFVLGLAGHDVNEYTAKTQPAEPAPTIMKSYRILPSSLESSIGARGAA